MSKTPKVTSTDAGDRALEKRSLRIGDKRTSLALEPQFWRALSEVSRREGISVPKLVLCIDATRPSARSLASAVRVYLLIEAPTSSGCSQPQALGGCEGGKRG